MATARCQLDPYRPGTQAEVLNAKLRSLVVGQDQAIGHIVSLYQMHLTGMGSPDRPIGTILFLGPTGSGKTRLVEAFAESLFGTAEAVIKIDCAEYQHSHEIAKLIGAPPGYLGHRETRPILCQETLNRFHTDTIKISLVLFDEVEKANDALWNLLLGILDKGTLMLGDNRKTDFARAFIFMTSNVGAAEMEGLIRPRWGFHTSPDGANRVEMRTAELSRVGVEAVRRKFSPEFINRLDAIVVFNPLGEAELRQIVEIELRRVQDRILNGKTTAFVFQLTESAIEQVLAEGTDPRYGARHLKRAIDRLVVRPISNLVASDQLQTGDWIMIDSEPQTRRMIFLKQAEALSPSAMAQLARLPLGERPLLTTAREEHAGHYGIRNRATRQH
jgi:ATP-dependent Clp protease ATP-binding subunit ClpA